MVYQEVSQEAGLGPSRLAGQAQAQEHSRTVNSLRFTAGITERDTSDVTNPTVEVLAPGTSGALGERRRAAAHR